MSELCQLYDEQGRALVGQGATGEELLQKGLLHAASHVWMWREHDGQAEVLVQKRAADKRTWASRYDISAAGHVDLGEEPFSAALRETSEELGLKIDASRLSLFGVHRAYLVAENGAIENEFQFLYLAKLADDYTFTLQESEVDSLRWVDLRTFRRESGGEHYVPHGAAYYQLVVEAIERAIE